MGWQFADGRRAWRWGAALALLALLIGLPARALAWDAVRMAAAAQKRGPAAVAVLPALQAMLRDAAVLDDADRLKLVNAFYNRRIVFQTDLQVWGQEDYWATPLEVLQQGRGDCEDYAIAKYATLLAAGVAPERLQLVYVRAQVPGVAVAQPHMVLVYQSGLAVSMGEPLVLDNLRPEVLPVSQRPDLTPVFSFNAEGLWQDNRPAGDPLLRLSRWRDVWQRTREEGFR